MILFNEAFYILNMGMILANETFNILNIGNDPVQLITEAARPTFFGGSWGGRSPPQTPHLSRPGGLRA